MTTRRVVCVLLDFFITALETETRPHLREKAVIVGGDPRRRGLVIAASPEALAFGVKAGMPSWEALRLCPQATILEPHPDLYHDRAQIVLGIVSLFGDQVEQSELDCFYLSMPGNSHDAVADMQRQVTQQAGVSVSIGVASSKLVAHLAASVRAPGGLVEAPAGQEASFMAPLPLALLVSDDRLCAQLTRLGLRTAGDLAAVPENLLAAHLGEAGKTLLRRAQGKDGRAVRATQQRETVEQEHVFDQVMSAGEALRRWTVYLSGRLGQDLRARQWQARTITLTLGHLDGPPTVLSAVLPRATDLDRTLHQTACHLLGAWDGRDGVASLGLEAGVFLNEPGFQLDFFSKEDTEQDERQQRLDHAKNGLNKRYGQGTVMAAMLLDDEILKAMGKKRRGKR